MTTEPAVSPDLPDLTHLTLAQLRLMPPRHLTEPTRRILAQVERPRHNIGGTSPPAGRAD